MSKIQVARVLTLALMCGQGGVALAQTPTLPAKTAPAAVPLTSAEQAAAATLAVTIEQAVTASLVTTPGATQAQIETTLTDSIAASGQTPAVVLQSLDTYAASATKKGAGPNVMAAIAAVRAVVAAQLAKGATRAIRRTTTPANDGAPNGGGGGGTSDYQPG